MKNKGGGARSGGGLQNQRSHCTNQNQRQGRGRNCEYQRSQRVSAPQPVMSIISSLLLGIGRLAHLSQKKIAMLSSRSDLISSGSEESRNPALEFDPQAEGIAQLEDRKAQLTTDNEKSKTTTTRQR